MTIFRRAILSDGRVIEYRQSPVYLAFKALLRWFWLPRWIVRRAQRYAIQRRVGGGSWQYVGVLS